MISNEQTAKSDGQYHRVNLYQGNYNFSMGKKANATPMLSGSSPGQQSALPQRICWQDSSSHIHRTPQEHKLLLIIGGTVLNSRTSILG